jgi:DnaJ-domain-containing protein 1
MSNSGEGFDSRNPLKGTLDGTVSQGKDGNEKALIASVFGTKNLSDIVRQEEKTLAALNLDSFVMYKAPGDSKKSASERFKSEVDALKLTRTQSDALKKMSDSFFADPRPDGAAMAQAIRGLNADDREPVVEAFKKLIESNANEKPDAPKQVRVTIVGDEKGYTFVFEGEKVNDGKHQLRFKSQDNSFMLTTKTGKPEGSNEASNKAVLDFRDFVREQFASRAVAKEDDKPKEKEAEKDKPPDDNAKECRKAMEALLKVVYPDNAAAQATALQLFDYYQGKSNDPFRGIQEKYKKTAETDLPIAEKNRNNDLARLFNAQLDAANNIKGISPDIFKNNPELKKQMQPKALAEMEDTVKLLTLVAKWKKDAGDQARLPAPNDAKPAPPVPKDNGVDNLGIAPHQPVFPGRKDAIAASRYGKLNAAKELKDPKDQAELESYKLGWTGDEPHYQYARAAYIKAKTELKLDPTQMETLKTHLQKYVAAYNVPTPTKPQEDIDAIKALLTKK